MRAMVMVGANFTDEDFSDLFGAVEEHGPESVNGENLVAALTRANEVEVIEVELID